MRNEKKAYFAGGCFWGVQYYFDKLEGVVKTKVGYMGGHVENPTFDDVCSDQSGHAEVVQVTYNPKKINFEELAKYFFEIHDPTQLNRQGPDVGSAYRSVIFCTDEEEKEIGEKLIKILTQKDLAVVTELCPCSVFYPAESYHQKYYDKNGHEPYCHFFTKRF